MSWWGSIDANFYLKDPDKLSDWKLDFFKRDLPQGSEEGPDVREDTYEGEHYIRVNGRLRDVTDQEDAAGILAWFCQRALDYDVDHADIEFEFDSGPRYRYIVKDRQLTKLKGILDG